MRRFFLRHAACVGCLVLCATEPGARADADAEANANDLPPAPPPPAVPPARWSVGVNPLAIGIGRYSVDGEWLARPHWALVANLHGDYASQAVVADYGAPMYGFGGELGARLYATPDLFGFFFGVSAISGWYNVEYYGERLALPDVGFAVDMGGKLRLGKGGMFMALGFGVQNLWTTTRYPKDIGQAASFVLGAGAAPRLLLTIGTVLP